MNRHHLPGSPPPSCGGDLPTVPTWALKELSVRSSCSGSPDREGQPMKVLDESGKSMPVGSTLKLEDLGLPVARDQAALLVFWKRQ